MAKRKRLTPPDFAAAGTPSGTTPGAPPETLEVKSMAPAPRRAPIADLAGDAATRAAFEQVAQELHTARREGRMIQAIALDLIDTDHLVRDRIVTDNDDMAALKSSIAARGVQTPIDVEKLGNGRFGLISGWRRLLALRGLHGETGDARFATVKALVRTPEAASDAYLAMIEENEIRAGLSYYERARIAARAAEQGAFATARIAVRDLFANASRAKRSKIMSFLTVYEALDGALRFPASISERLGLALAKQLTTEAGQGDAATQIRTGLAQKKPATPDAEQQVLTELLTELLHMSKQPPEPVQERAGGKTDPALHEQSTKPPVGVQVAPVTLSVSVRGQIFLGGPGLTPAFRASIEKLVARNNAKVPPDA
jgi:ParB family chromosome partitioning protein